MTRRRSVPIRPTQTLFRVCEIAEASGVPYSTCRRWLHRAGLLEVVAPNSPPVVARERLACEMPRLWDALCRRYEARVRAASGANVG